MIRPIFIFENMKNLTPILFLLLIISCNKGNIAPTSKVERPKTHSPEKPSVTDTVFSDVINIEKNDIVLRNDSLVISKKISEKTPVLYIEDRQPVDLLPSILPEFPRVIVITPNWIGYDEVAKSAPEGGCAEPTVSTVVYEFTHRNRKITKDSAIYYGNVPTINFKKK